MADHYTQLFTAVEACKPRRILEIGTWNGEHGAGMIRIAQRFHSDVEYYGFDLWAPADVSEISKPAMNRDAVAACLNKTGAKIALYQGNTRETLPRHAGSLPPMDFIFIDGGHSLETIANDWHHCSKLMHRHTVVVLDDYYPDRTDAGAKTLVDALSLDPKYSVSLGLVTEYPGMLVQMATVRLT
jgi:predicted O-methyltransferase YrrM